MRVQLVTTILAAGLVLGTAAATNAHDGPADGPRGGGPMACPAPPPAARPAQPRPMACPARHETLARGHAWRRPGRRVAAGPAWNREDDGVAVSQARVYRRELATHGFPGRDARAHGDWGSPPRAFAQGGDGARGAHYGYERREFTTESGHVEGQRDGHRYAWSWGGGGGRPGGPAPCEPCRDRQIHGDVARGDGPPWRQAQGGGYETYGYAGRDERGYLVWASKRRW